MKLEINVNVFLHPCPSDSDKLEQILQQLNRLTKATQQEAHELTLLEDKIAALETKVAAETDQITGAETLLSNLSQLLKDAIAQGGDQSALAARVQALADGIDAKTSELAAAVVANTPAAPPATDQPTA